MLKLNRLQQKTLSLFARSGLADKFYWTGGTLLSAFYLGHRFSEDLDFFSDKPFDYNEIIGFIRQLKKVFKLSGVEEKKIFDRWEFFIHNKEKLRLDFAFYEHPKLKPRKKWQGVLIDSLEDITANKIMAFFDRREPKDLVDIYFLLTRKEYKIQKLLSWTEKKFGVRISESSFWSECLRGRRDLERIRPLLIAKNKEKTIKEVKNYFSIQSAGYLKRSLEQK